MIKNVTNKDWTHEDHMRFGVFQGWWKEWDEIGPIKTLSAPFGTLIEDILVDHKIFNSKSESRRTGFSGPLQKTVWIKKRRIKIEVEQQSMPP